LTVNSATYNDTYNFYTMELEEELQAGSEYEIEFHFVSKINEELNGLYRSTYTIPETGESKYVIGRILLFFTGYFLSLH